MPNIRKCKSRWRGVPAHDHAVSVEIESYGQAMKLLQVTNYFHTHRGGLENIAFKIASGLAAEPFGFDVTWVASEGSPVPEPHDGKLSYVAMRTCNLPEDRFGIPFPLWYPASLWRLRRLVEASDVILLHDCLYMGNVAAFEFAKAANKPVVVLQHIGFVPYGNPIFRWLMLAANYVLGRRVLRGATRILVYSETTAKYWQDKVRFARPPIFILNGVDTTTFRPLEPAARNKLRSDLALQDDKPIVLFVGRFVPKKGLAVVRELATARRDWQFVLAGWGVDDPRQWNLPNVRVENNRSGSSIAELYQAADLLILPSVGEGFPLVIQEAMACGLAVMCGDETAAADSAAAPLLVSAPVDLTDPVGTARLWDGSLPRALDNSHESAALERAAFARRQWSWDAAISLYASLLRDITAS
jgi:glycosyltransferase involved in cell wall biosynthesis